MGKIKILATGTTNQDKANSRGKLFEQLMTKVLQQLGVKIDKVSNRNFSGMEIDICGNNIVDKPIYAECKYYENEIDSNKIQAFLGKYTALWFRNNKAEGLFFAIPSLNSHAHAFYEDNIKNNSQISLKYFSESDILNLIISNKIFADPNTLSMQIPNNYGYSKDWDLIYTEKGIFWLFYIILKGETKPKFVTIYDNKANPISKDEYNFFCQLDSTLEIYDYLDLTEKEPSVKLSNYVKTDIVEIKAASASFEYQFPSAPEYFIGRQQQVNNIIELKNNILENKTSIRGILFQANSGFGKSSLVIYLNKYFNDSGDLSFAIDCRTASNVNFIKDVIEYILEKLSLKNTLFMNYTDIMNKYEPVEAILEIAKLYKKENKILFIFLDQFENVLYQPDVLKQIRDFYFRILDSQTNIVIGFSWKTDLYGKTTDFPYKLRDDISEKCLLCSLAAFNQEESNKIINLLEKEVNKKINKELAFYLTNFSQGYPWLLKKLCNHIKTQLTSNISQNIIANTLLNAEELFKEDLSGLTPEELQALHFIAKISPVSIADISDKIDYKIIQSLINRRLLVLIGTKYDTYWDIFRDYLNTGKIPIQETYYLQKEPITINNVIENIINNKIKSVKALKNELNISDKSLGNILKDMKNLDIVEENNNSELVLNKYFNNKKFKIYKDDILREYLQTKLLKNRLYSELYNDVQLNSNLNIKVFSKKLALLTPYISANEDTWETYAKRMAKWLSYAKLTIYNVQDKVISSFDPNEWIPETYIIRNEKSFNLPVIQIGAAIRVMEHIFNLVNKKRTIDSNGFTKTTFKKSIYTLESIGLISLKNENKKKLLGITLNGVIFVTQTNSRKETISKFILDNNAFIVLIDILNKNLNKRLKQSELAKELKSKLGTNWTIETSKTNIKIMMDWLRFAELLPKVYKHK